MHAYVLAGLVAVVFCYAGVAALAAEPAVVGFPAGWESVYRVDPRNPYQLVNDQGRHLFILNKTAWAYFGCARPEVTLDRGRQLGANVIRVTLEGTPYEKELGIDLWPWGGTRKEPDWGSFNEPYWNEVERRIEMAGKRGIGVDLCLYFTLKPKAEDAASHRAYWQQCLRRLGKYANVLCWEIHNEYLGDEAFQDAAGTYFAEHDPHGRPVITSAGTTDGAAWPEKPWVGMAINHTCTGAQEAYTLDGWYLPLARNLRAFGKPAWCNESGREKRHGNDDGVYRRKQGWLWSAAGCFWTWHSWDGCEGIDDAAYVAPGEEFVRPMAEFFRGIEFWRLQPYETGVRAEDGIISAALADAERKLIVAYLCTQKTGQRVDAPAVRVQLPKGSFELACIAPVTREVTSTMTVEAQGLNRVQRVALPAFTDDVVVVLRRSSGADAGPVPGTR